MTYMPVPTMLYGVPVEDIIRLIQFTQEQGFHTVQEFLTAKREPAEYQATVSLLKARLARIAALTTVEV